MDVKNDMVVGDQYPGVGIQTRHNSAIGPLFVHRPLYPSSGDQTFSESEPGDGSMNVARFARSGRILKVHLLVRPSHVSPVSPVCGPGERQG